MAVRKSTYAKAAQVKEILAKNYEPGRHDKCKAAVYRNIIQKQTGMGLRTFRRYVNEINENPIPKTDDTDQLRLKLFDEEEEWR